MFSQSNNQKKHKLKQFLILYAVSTVAINIGRSQKDSSPSLAGNKKYPVNRLVPECK